MTLISTQQLVIVKDNVGTYMTGGIITTGDLFFSSPAMPKIMGLSGHDNTVRMAAEVGTEVVLPCEAQGSPSPLVTWRRNGHVIPPVTAG